MQTKSPTTRSSIPPPVRPVTTNADQGGVARPLGFGVLQPVPSLGLLRLGTAMRGDWRSWPPPEPAR